jgi:hypothetical protein
MVTFVFLQNSLHFVAVLLCCSLAGTEEAEQALQVELPNCEIFIGQDEDSNEDEDQDEDSNEDQDQD